MEKKNKKSTNIFLFQEGDECPAGEQDGLPQEALQQDKGRYTHH